MASFIITVGIVWIALSIVRRFITKYSYYFIEGVKLGMEEQKKRLKNEVKANYKVLN